MPYIQHDDRTSLDVHINALAEEINKLCESRDTTAFAGLLNYSITTLALKVIPTKRYWTIALVSGVFHNAGDEFYRRYAAPYEDEQVKKNGDCY